MPVTVTPSEPRHRHLSRLAWWLDSSIKVPGTQWRIGLDPLIGLVPGVGDLVGLGISAYILAYGARLGAPRSVLARMTGNVLIDSLVGAVPLAGDVFDAAWKANERNVRLLERFIDQPARTRRASALVVAVEIAAVLAVVGTLAVLVFAVLRWAFTTAF